MTALLELLEGRLGPGALDPSLERFLGPLAAPVLAPDPVPVGVTQIATILPLLGELLPLPAGSTSGVAADVPDGVTARLIGATGWEVRAMLPALVLSLPPIMTPATVVDGPDGRTSLHPDPGTCELHLAAGAAVVVSGDDGGAIRLALAGAAVSVVPPVLALPGGFGLQVGPLTIADDGVSLPDATFYLPALPELPAPPIPCPVRFDRLGAAAGSVGGRLLGLAGEATVPVAGLASDLAGELRFEIHRPHARSLADLVPTSVRLTVPLGDAPVRIAPGIEPEPEPMGDVASLVATLVVAEDDTITVRAAVEGGGDARGIMRIGENALDDPALLAVPAALAPWLEIGDGAAALVATLLAAGALGAVAGGRTAETTIQGVRLEATWSRTAAAPPSSWDIRLDYEAAIDVEVSAGVVVRTRDGQPVRVRHRDVRVTMDPVPALSWVGATTTLVSPGDWEVKGVPDEILRVADARPGRGSVTIDLDLRVGVELGPVSVDATTVRIGFDDGFRVEPAAFGVGLEIPGVIEGRGWLAFDDGDPQAALDVSLPAIGASGRALVAIRGDMVVVAIHASLITPIPFANSGLGLFGFGGLMAVQATRNVPGGAGVDPIRRELDWDPTAPTAFMPGSQAYLGLTADIGTVPDLGFSFSSEAGILFAIPDPFLRVVLSARLLKGIGGTLLGVLVVDGDAVTIALRGDYELPGLLRAVIPAGARFPYEGPGWEARIGGDRSARYGEPVLVTVFPELFTLEGWAFVIALGAAPAGTVIGAALLQPGIAVQGLTLAFGAGLDVHWEAGPFSFDASGAVVAAITHLPPGDRWALVGRARIAGAVDLGPVSIGASAELEATIVPQAEIWYAHARACASIDLWFTEIEGCVEIDIGDPPQVPAPVPGSPLLGLRLSDRLGIVTGDAAEQGGQIPVVWPDTVPVLTFSHWVAADSALPGLRKAVGNVTPSTGEWVGSESLAYRFRLASVRVIEVASDGTETEVGMGLDAAWQLPLSANVFDSADVPAEARALALNTFDTHQYLHAATHAGAGHPGDPLGVIGRLCIPLMGDDDCWYAGGDARLAPDGVRIPRRDGPSGPDLRASIASDRGRMRIDGELEAHVPPGWDLAVPTWVDRFEAAPVEGHVVTGGWWLPWVAREPNLAANVPPMAMPVGVELGAPLEAPAVLLAVPWPEPEVGEGDGRIMVSDDAAGELRWDSRSLGPFDFPDGTRGELWLYTRADPRAPVTTLFVVPDVPPRRAALLGVAGVDHEAAERRRANDRARDELRATADDAASTAKTSRTILAPGATYRVVVDMTWEARRDGGTPSAPEPYTQRTFSFRTAPPAAEEPIIPPAAEGSVFDGLLVKSPIALLRFGEVELDPRALARYVAGVIPGDGVLDHFHDDPVGVEFLVDHLPDLVARYDDTLAVRIRRTDAPPGTPSTHVQQTIPGAGDPRPALPFLLAAFTALDRHRAGAAQADAGCRWPTPGMSTVRREALDPLATYRVSATVDPTLGRGATIVEATFRTSRYANAAGLFEDLGLGAVGGRPARLLPLPVAIDDARLREAASAAESEKGFDEAMRAVGLGGYEAPARATTSVVVIETAAGPRIVGVLLEAPEPIRRLGRLLVREMWLDGITLTQTAWDGRGSRLLALTSRDDIAAASVIRVVAHEPGGSAPPRILDLRCPVPADLSPLQGVLA